MKKKAIIVIISIIVIICIVISGLFIMRFLMQNNEINQNDARIDSTDLRANNVNVPLNQSYDANTNQSSESDDASSSSNANANASSNNAVDSNNSNNGTTSTSVSDILTSRAAAVESGFAQVVSTGNSSDLQLAALDDIPESKRDMDNLVYKISSYNGNLNAAYEGSERKDINVISITPISADSNSTIVEISYDFTVHYTSAMDESGIPADKRAHSDATITMNSAGKIIDWREQVKWGI